MVEGPAVGDVAANFVDRWNGARALDGFPAEFPAATDGLSASSSPEPVGEVDVQVTRTVQPGWYGAAPGRSAAAVDSLRDGAGERSVEEAYLAAIEVASVGVYLENQTLASPPVVDELLEALERNVRVIAVVPGASHPEFAQARRQPEFAAFFEPLKRLGRYEHFLLAALRRPDHLGDPEVYVHAKLMIVDDRWWTVGSTNLADQSFHRDTELNLSVWDARTAHSLRRRLFSEHLGGEPCPGDLVAGMECFAQQARANAQAHAAGNPARGLAHAIDPSTYGLEPAVTWPQRPSWPA